MEAEGIRRAAEGAGEYRAEAEVIGVQEFSSIAAGIQAVDAMVKAAPVSILRTGVVCPGKFVALITGEVAEVDAALAAGRDTAAAFLVDELFIPNLHPRVLPAIRGEAGRGEPLAARDALGVIECYSVAAGIEAADIAAKEADVRLPEVRLAYEMGGKSFLQVTGPIEDVEAAVRAGAAHVERKGLLCHRIIIANPHPDIRPHVLKDRWEERELWR